MPTTSIAVMNLIQTVFLSLSFAIAPAHQAAPAKATCCKATTECCKVSCCTEGCTFCPEWLCRLLGCDK